MIRPRRRTPKGIPFYKPVAGPTQRLGSQNTLDWVRIEDKWQRRWEDSKIFESQPGRPGRNRKFFVIFAYPGTSGYLHVGHMRGYTLADVVARYKRMDGYNVLFPCGTHASGNQATVFAAKVKKGDAQWIHNLLANGCPPDKIPELADPVKVVAFLNKVYIEQYWKRFGLSIDYRRFTSTVNPDYARFIQWQFRKLHRLGLLRKKTYYGPACPHCGPVAIDASETDLSKGGKAEKIELVTVPFRTEDGWILPAATLRPETIRGVTNLWMDPDSTYVKATTRDRTRGRTRTSILIVSEQALEKLRLQHPDIRRQGEIRVPELIGRTVRTPLTGSTVPVLPSPVVDAEFGTGIVMSVPAHSPSDWIALRELSKAELPEEVVRKVEVIKPLTVIDQTRTTMKICEDMGIQSLNQKEDLEKAIEVVNRTELSEGRMNQHSGSLAGFRVAEARAVAARELARGNPVPVMYQLSEKVICRCGREVMIRRIPDQWFINYAQPELKEKSKQHMAQMRILPPSFARNMAKIIDWFRERPCARKGRWLGTPMPLDPHWIIEPISDSTLYPAFYTISHLTSQINPRRLTEEALDYIFLGKGRAEAVSQTTRIDPSLLRAARQEFDYWYPVDLNIGGKEHQTVHFPVFVMNHAAIMPRREWPRGILCNWWIVMKGGKISKSKGGASPIPHLAETYTVDGMRLYYSNVASPYTDVEWREETAMEYRVQVEKAYQAMMDLLSMDRPASDLDSWMLSKLQRRVQSTRRYLESLEFRKASNEAIFGVLGDVRWYLRRGGGERTTMRQLLDVWIRLVAPFTPHMAEEAWEMTGGEGFASAAPYPEVEQALIDLEAERREDYLASVISDIRRVIEATGKQPEKVTLYTTTGRDGFDEHTVLHQAEEFMSRELRRPVVALRAGDPSAPGPTERKAKARPLRPAIWLA